MQSTKRVVIVGGGFGGLYTAKGLANRGVHVTLIDKKNHHTFQPLLYQVASGVLSPGQIASPLRHVLRKAKNISVVLAEVTGFDLVNKRVQLLEGGDLPYDSLIVAAGARHSYFGHDEWESDAPGLKTLEDAVEMRRRILLAFEQAEREQLAKGSHEPLTFAIVGGGPTGVELAGAIADIARRVVADEFRAIDTRKARVMLFQGAPNVLAEYPPDVCAQAKRQLEELGVEVFTSSRVTDITCDKICVEGEWIDAHIAFWATGVAASPLGKALGVELDRAGRVIVQTDLSVPGNPDVFVLGDMASLTDAKGRVVPGLAASAMQMGKHTAKNILRDIQGQPRLPFAYLDKGSMATIGRNRAVAKIGKWHPTGFIAWALWGIVHVILLTGFRSKLTVMREWAWAYFTVSRSAGLITGNSNIEP